MVDLGCIVIMRIVRMCVLHWEALSPETPIRDVVDRCRVWESHAYPEIRRVSKPSPDPIYPAYVVGDSDHIGETLLVAAVTKPKSPPDQLEDLLGRLLANMATPVPVAAPFPEGRRWKNCCSDWWRRHRVTSRRL